jgi:hypothetical protein
MMRSEHRLAHVVTCLVIGVGLLGGCGEPEDETGGGVPSSAPGGLGAVPPPPQPTAELDPETKKSCDSLWGFNVFAYSARVTAEMTPSERDRHRKGLDDYEPLATLSVPTLRTDIKALATQARAVLAGSGPAELTPELGGSNTRIVDYFGTVCKFKMS